jgi:hypothetical protein
MTRRAVDIDEAGQPFELFLVPELPSRVEEVVGHLGVIQVVYSRVAGPGEDQVAVAAGMQGDPVGQAAAAPEGQGEQCLGR